MILRVALIALLAGSLTAYSQPAEVPPEVSTPTEEEDAADTVDSFHENISDKVETVAEGLDHYLDNLIAPDREERSKTFDRYFGDRRLNADEEGESYIAIAPQIEFIDGESVSTGVDFKAKIDLPKTQNRLKLIVENVQEDSEPLTGFSRNELRQIPGSDDSGNASLRFAIIDLMNFDLDLDSGLDFKPEPVPKFRLRGRMSWQREHWRFRVSQYLTYEADDGFGEKTSLDLRRFLGEASWVEVDLAVVRSETSDGFEFGQAASLYHRISNRRTIGFRAALYSQTEPWARIEAGLLRMPYRQKIWKEWMYLTIEPGIDFKRERNFNPDPRILFELEFLFGERLKRL
tara:strand:- start:2449 stop:3486 length:1038 start_codon:yes stop_codon:yes gene_type:complete